jgi:hypothetical protein
VRWLTVHDHRLDERNGIYVYGYREQLRRYRFTVRTIELRNACGESNHHLHQSGLASARNFTHANRDRHLRSRGHVYVGNRERVYDHERGCADHGERRHLYD